MAGGPGTIDKPIPTFQDSMGNRYYQDGEGKIVPVPGPDDPMRKHPLYDRFYNFHMGEQAAPQNMTANTAPAAAAAMQNAQARSASTAQQMQMLPPNALQALQAQGGQAQAAQAPRGLPMANPGFNAYFQQGVQSRAPYGQPAPLPVGAPAGITLGGGRAGSGMASYMSQMPGSFVSFTAPNAGAEAEAAE